MSTNFGVLKTNVGNRVGDTSSTFATIIGTYINQRYKEVLRRTNFYSINPDFTMTASSASTVVSASTHALPSDFGKELYVYNSGTKESMSHMSLEKLEQEYTTALETAGTVYGYSIFDTKDTSAASAEASAARIKKIRFFKAPSTDNHFTIPYIMSPADLSADSDQLTVDCETAVELGATSDAWLYKRQSAKAQHYEALYEKAIENITWDKSNQPNQLHMMNPLALNRNEGI